MVRIARVIASGIPHHITQHGKTHTVDVPELAFPGQRLLDQSLEREFNSSYRFSDHAGRASLFLFRHTPEDLKGIRPTSYYSAM